jgi:hypothetical protein
VFEKEKGESKMNENYLPISLPSKCLPYENIDSSKVLIRPYQGADEILLSQITPLNLESKFLCVLKNVLQGIDPERLTLGDRFYIILWEFINSYTNIISLTTLCSHCLKEVEFSVDLSVLDVTYLPDSYKQPYSVILSDGSKVKLKLLSVKDVIETEKYSKIDSENDFLYEYAGSIVDDRGLPERVTWLSTLKARDLALIRTFQEKFIHGPNMVTKVTCPKCREEEELIVPFWFEYFFPKGKILVNAFGARI